MLVKLPDVYCIDERIGKSLVRQLAARPGTVECTRGIYKLGKKKLPLIRLSESGETILVVPHAQVLPDTQDLAIKGAIEERDGHIDLSRCDWTRHPQLDPPLKNRRKQIEAVLASWRQGVAFVEAGDDPTQVGLREPQLGALHAILAHWSVSDGAATIVMPTGTGKTDLMLSILISERCKRLLVVVPTDALRSQIASKFLTLGILKSEGSTLIEAEATWPIVSILRHRPRSVSEAREIIERSQVVITTSSVAGQCAEEVQELLASDCSHLFIDEAHHVEAPTWRRFKEKFYDRRVVQFTATPFREDGRPLDGKIVYSYPLARAQQRGYFRPIRFVPVVEFSPTKSDEAIADAAVHQLRQDFDKGHILMARVSSVKRASEVFAVYARHTEFNPVQLHTGIKSTRQRSAIRDQLLNGTSRIVVCVDMLGEGFDLPELKIAAFHDIRRSLPVTLQLAGRFTRARPDLGDATFVANTADVQVQEELRKLYSRQPDWNALLPDISDQLVGDQISLQQFLSEFSDFSAEIPLRMVRPAASAVVYRTSCVDWSPEAFGDGIPNLSACDQVHHTINHAAHTLVVVTARRSVLNWTDSDGLFELQWDLYVVVWSPELSLLFINASGNVGTYGPLARAVGGDSVSLVRGQDVFRTFLGVNRLRLQNVGLTEQLGRNVRYTGRMGSDVAAALTNPQRQRAIKSVLSGHGFEEGRRASVGASRKGRIWSQLRLRLDEFRDWCLSAGRKLLDETIDPDQVLRGTLEAVVVSDRPSRMPIAVEWPEQVFREPESAWLVTINDEDYGLDEISLEVHDPSLEGDLDLELTTDDAEARLRLEFMSRDKDNPDFKFTHVGGGRVFIRRGDRADPTALDDFFTDNPPIVWFHDGSSLEGNQHVELKRTLPPIDRAQIHVLDWGGVNIRRESQGAERSANTVQGRLLRELSSRGYDVLFDDDDKGEAADVVAVKFVGAKGAYECIEVELYHCKYSASDKPGARVGDLYEVCGQAQKSTRWAWSHEKKTDLFTHLLRRNAKREAAIGSTRFEVGDGDVLLAARDASHVCPVNLSVFVVQPGLSRKGASEEQLQLLAVTKNYLDETFQIPFGVFGSD